MKFEYTFGGQKVALKVADNMLAVRFREPAPYSVRAAAVSRPEMESFDERFEVPAEKFTVFKVARSPQAREERLANAMGAIGAEAEVERCSPVFIVGDTYAIATDRLMVGFTTGAGAKKILKDYGCDVLEQTDNEFVVSIGPSADPFEVIARLDELSQVEYAEPDFVTFGRHVARPDSNRGPSDPLAPSQYAIRITKAQKAWQLQVGNPAIKIAILDEGVETGHEDLAAAIVGNYDGVDDDSFQEPKPWDAHGTACAGLAAAIHGNQTGIKGIGGGCSLVAVRIAYSRFDGDRWTSRNSWIKRAIDWSWNNGADVLSNSWGGGTPSSAITNAFSRARTQGRDGKGCVIVIAAGNANSLHDYPGNLDDVLTVAASNEYDEPKTPSSQDGEDWWGSNYGPKIDVAAPGVHNYTTDISGRAGYNKLPEPDGNYVSNFNGTSSATPIVAGAVGLMLSANPDRTEAEVRGTIRDTADKVGPLPYVNGRNDRMGHGRLNVLGAVRAALGLQDEEIPTGKHAPVSNADPDSEREVNVLMAHPATPGEAKTTKLKTQDGREEVAAKARALAAGSFEAPSPWRVHASLLITARDGSRWIGTGWFIGPHTLVTAGHVVYITNSGVPGRDGWVRRIDVMPGRNGAQLPYGSVSSEIFNSVVGWTQDGDPQYDYGAISIPTELGDQVGTIGFGVLSKTELLRSTGNLAGYPGDKPDGTLWYDYNRVASVTTRKVYYDVDTAGGQSGAAVYRIEGDGNRTAFGIHAYGGATTNSATRITTPVYQNLQNWMRD
jgi:V8-like Glu-specific endopeptidase